MSDSGKAARRLRIAQVAPLYESVPPKLYGGTERVVSYLTEELVDQGHRVTLFASGDSRTTAELVSVWPRALRLDPRCPEPIALHVVMLEEVFKRESHFDIIHFHTDGLHPPLARRHTVETLTTLHGRLDLPGLELFYGEFRELPLVSISQAQRSPLPSARWVGTVHHGLPLSLHAPNYQPGQYLAFIGRISPEKGLDRAIAIALRAQMRLRIAAKIDRVDSEYFRRHIEPLLQSPLVEYIGEIDERQKTAFLGCASALLFPVDWPEPFGLAMIEAMACGTPVIAFRRGSVPEVIDEGVTGCVVDNVDAAVQEVLRIGRFDRRRVRERFEQRFSARRMAEDYSRVYYGLCELRDRRCRRRA
ncbi:MAG: glycosyltransferase family 4 protein [Sinobacteraceae bacterium]|nr:glycosyltransferase family 4 protein [Nevskiaceae bacterium]